MAGELEFMANQYTYVHIIYFIMQINIHTYALALVYIIPIIVLKYYRC